MHDDALMRSGLPALLVAVIGLSPASSMSKSNPRWMSILRMHKSADIIKNQQFDAQYATKADYTGLLVETSHAGGISDASNGTNKNMMGDIRYNAEPLHIVPDTLKQAADGDDDAPSLNRVAAKCRSLHIRCQVDFRSRIYNINSAVDFSETQVVLNGVGVQERTAGIAGAITVSPWLGTWLQVSKSTFSPVTIGGYGGGNTVVQNLGIYEVQPTPLASGSWTPIAYPAFFSSHNGGMTLTYRHIFMLAITRGIYSDGDQRLTIDGIQGQTFQYVVAIHHAYDVATITNIHQWTFWSMAQPVLAYQQANNDVLVLGRLDGAFTDKIFTFASRSAYHLTQDGNENTSEPGGMPTKIWAGSTYCDFTYTCIYTDKNVANFDFSAGYMTTQGQKWALRSASPAIPISGASAFIIQGYGNLNIHELYTQYADNSVGQLLNSANGSYVNIGSMRVDTTPMRANGFLFGALVPSSGTNTITLGTRPFMLGRQPPSFTVFQPGSGLNVVWPQVTTVANGTVP